MKRIALVTQLTDDGTPLVSSDVEALLRHADLLARYGLTLISAAWEDPSVEWGSFDAIAIRSCWNYHLPERMDAFRRWLDMVEPLNVWNPVPVIRWNSDKIYLRDLAAVGVPVVPSVWRDAGAPLDVAAAMAEQGWSKVVIKPRTGASAFGVMTAASPADADAANARAAEFAVSGAVIQPLLEEIRTDGEWSFLCFRGPSGRLELSHTVVKRPIADGRITVQGGTFEMLTPPDALAAQAIDIVRRAEALTGASLLHVRVDAVLRGDTLTLMELELIEPSLFLHEEQAAPMLENYVRALASIV